MEGRRAILRRRLLAAAVLLVVGVVVWQLVKGATKADKHGAHVEHITIHSQAAGQALPVTVVRPAGSRGDSLPLLVFLHGRGGDENSELVDEFYAALADLGARAPLVAFPYGGDHSYWHDRVDGDWAHYVIDDVIPQVAADFDADLGVVAVGGISMGGFGAFNLALDFPGRFCAVGGHSPALWQSAGETAEGAFDDADDFAANDVIASATAGAPAFKAQPLWLDAGSEDPFQPGDQAFAAALEAEGADATVDLTQPGGHDDDYWNAHWDEYLGFYADALASCSQ